ncbi:MAG: hypothetical protein KF812_10625, partial [Fimbriimonadaceae bacterium]|nr:hypothetical protein [Fimbriimonadaceae bacterium]
MVAAMLLGAILPSTYYPFKSPEPRFWIGPEFWGNRNHDWQLSPEGLECISPLPNRNLAYLSSDTAGDFVATFDVQWLNQTRAQSEARVGVEFDCAGSFNDYRDSAVYGRGTFVGFNPLGQILIGEKEFPGPGRLAMRQGVNLQVVARGEVVTVFARWPGASASFSAAVERKTGLLKFVSHLPGYQSNGGPVTRFRNFRFSGGTPKPEQAWGPVLFCLYTTNANTLNLTAQLPAMERTTGHLELKKGSKWEI